MRNPLTPALPAILALLLLACVAAPALAGVDMEALRAFFERESGVYAADEEAVLVLARVSHGDEALFRNVLVEVSIGSGEPVRLRYRIKEALVPQSERHFHMPIDLKLLGLGPGTHPVMVRLDSTGTVPETDEGNNTARTRLTIAASPGIAAPAPGIAAPAPGIPTRMAPIEARSILIAATPEGRRSWTDPLEAGFHPGYGSSQVLLRFPHPGNLTAFSAGGRGPVLHLEAAVLGRPFQELGPLEVYVRTVAAEGAPCEPAGETRIAVADLAGLEEIDLEGRIPAAPTSRLDCREHLEILLAFPPPSGPRPDRAALLRIRREAAALVAAPGPAPGAPTR